MKRIDSNLKNKIIKIIEILKFIIDIPTSVISIILNYIICFVRQLPSTIYLKISATGKSSASTKFSDDN